MKWIFLCFCILVCSLNAAERYPVSLRDKIPTSIIKPWIGESPLYTVDCTAMDTDFQWSAGVKLFGYTSKNSDEILHTIIHWEVLGLAIKPKVTVFNDVKIDPKSGRITHPAKLKGWRMVQYEDPNTAQTVKGILVDNFPYVDLPPPVHVRLKDVPTFHVQLKPGKILVYKNETLGPSELYYQLEQFNKEGLRSRLILRPEKNVSNAEKVEMSTWFEGRGYNVTLKE